MFVLFLPIYIYIYIYNSKVKKDTLELSFHLLLPVSSILEFSSNVIYVTTSMILFPASTLLYSGNKGHYIAIQLDAYLYECFPVIKYFYKQL